MTPFAAYGRCPPARLFATGYKREPMRQPPTKTTNDGVHTTSFAMLDENTEKGRQTPSTINTTNLVQHKRRNQAKQKKVCRRLEKKKRKKAHMVQTEPSGPSRNRSRSWMSCTEDDVVAGGSIHTRVALIPPAPVVEPPSTAVAASSSVTVKLRSSTSEAST